MLRLRPDARGKRFEPFTGSPSLEHRDELAGLFFPGTYKVTVNELGDTNLPDRSTVVVERSELP